MDGALLDLAAGYRERYGSAVQEQEKLRGLHSFYREEALQGEANLIDAITGAASLQGILLNDHVEWFQVPSQVKEAFKLAFPSFDPVERINELNAQGWVGAHITGFLNRWTGNLFEVIVVDLLNRGRPIGPVRLALGQVAELAKNRTQPGWDVLIRNSDGSVAQYLQLKAGKTLTHLKDSLEKYGDILHLTTTEAALKVDDSRAINSGISAVNVRGKTQEAIEMLQDSPIEKVWEVVGPLLPYVVIVVSEGGKFILGRQAFRDAYLRSMERGVKQAIVTGVGITVAALPGPNVLGLPAVTLTRMSMTRYDVNRRIVQHLEEHINTLRQLLLGGAQVVPASV